MNENIYVVVVETDPGHLEFEPLVAFTTAEEAEDLSSRIDRSYTTTARLIAPYRVVPPPDPIVQVDVPACVVCGRPTPKYKSSDGHRQTCSRACLRTLRAATLKPHQWKPGQKGGIDAAR